MKQTGQMSYRNLLANLKDVMYRYFDAKEIDTFDKLAEAFVYKQLIAALPDPVRQFVMSKEAKTADEAARIADLSWKVSKIGKERNFQQPSQHQTQPGYENNQRQAGPFSQNREQGKNFDATKFRTTKPSFQNSRPFSGNGRNEHVHRGGRFSGGKQGNAFLVNKMHANNAADCDAMS